MTYITLLLVITYALFSSAKTFAAVYEVSCITAKKKRGLPSYRVTASLCTQRKHRKETWWEATALVSFWSWTFENYLVFFLLRKIRYHLVVNYLYQTEVANVPLARLCSPALRLETDRTLGAPEGQALIWFHAMCHSSNTGTAHVGAYHTIVFKINDQPIAINVITNFSINICLDADDKYIICMTVVYSPQQRVC